MERNVENLVHFEGRALGKTDFPCVCKGRVLCVKIIRFLIFARACSIGRHLDSFCNCMCAYWKIRKLSAAFAWGCYWMALDSIVFASCWHLNTFEHRGCRFGHPGQKEFSADFNADFNTNGMFKEVSTPKVQRRWKTVATPVRGFQITTPKGAWHFTAQKHPPRTEKLTTHKFQRQRQIPTPIGFNA